MFTECCAGFHKSGSRTVLAADQCKRGLLFSVPSDSCAVMLSLLLFRYLFPLIFTQHLAGRL